MNKDKSREKSKEKPKKDKSKKKGKESKEFSSSTKSTSATSPALNGDHHGSSSTSQPIKSSLQGPTSDAVAPGNDQAVSMMEGDLNNDDSQTKQQSPDEIYYAAISLGLPTPYTTIPDPSDDKCLKPIRDDGSSHAQVARSCLQITQFVGGSGSGAAGGHDGHAVASTHLYHDKTYARIVSDCFAALITCIKEHKDRRCRILACQTLAKSARSAYAQIRHAPILFCLRDSVLHRLEDEVGSEVPTALLNVALDDGDDGVSASAIEALGILVLATSNAASGTIIDDELLQEIQAMAFARVSPYAPSLRTVMLSCHTTMEEDPSVAQLELQSRIFRNIMAPRLLHLVTRIVHYNSSHHHQMTMPFVTACLIHQIRTNNANVFHMDRMTYAKRWVDLDITGLINDVITALVLPSMQHCFDGDLAHTAALCSLRLANACPNSSWVLEVCRWAVVVLKEEISATGVLESKAASLATLLIALRPIPLPERTPILESMVNDIASLPFTTMVPHGVNSPGLRIETGNALASDTTDTTLPSPNTSDEGQSAVPFACYRKPARIAFFTEIALSIFMDGPVGASLNTTSAVDNSEGLEAPVKRSVHLKQFLSSPPVVSICKEPENPAIIKMRDEILLVFTTVAWETGRRFRVSADGSLLQPPPMSPGQSSFEVEEWTRLAFTILSIFSPCARWGHRPEYLEEDLWLLTAGQSGYIRLLQEFLHFVGLLDPMSCVAFKLTPNACPPHLLWDQMIESASFLTHWDAVTSANRSDNNGNNRDDLTDRSFMGCCSDVMAEDIAALVDDFIEKDLRQGIISHHMRMFILTLGVDQWVQSRYMAIRRHLERGDNQQDQEALAFSLSPASARDLLVAVSPKRLLTKLLEYHTVPVDAQGKKKKDPIKKLALETVRVCVAAVENIALTAIDWKRRFGSNQESHAIVQLSIASLEGKVDDEPMDESLKPVMGPLCDAACLRIQSFLQARLSSSDSLPASELVTQPMKYKIKPLVSTSSSGKGADREGLAVVEYMHGYLMQFSRQIISSRVDMALHSRPNADAFFTCFARTKNWLRLSTPPLPQSRDARGIKFRGPQGGNNSSVWGKNITSITSGSDPVAAVVAHVMSRTTRYDNDDEYRVKVLMQVWNATAVEITEGLTLELGIECQQHDTGMDSTSLEFLSALGGTPEDVQNRTAPLVSAASTYKHPVNAGDHIVWEITLNHLMAGRILFHPSIIFRNIEEEATYAAKVGGNTTAEGKAPRRLSTNTFSSNKGEDDFQVSTKVKGTGFGGDQSQSENVKLESDPIVLSPLLGLQPCPLVFFRDSWGDLDTFRFLWFRMPNAVPPIALRPKSAFQDDGFLASNFGDDDDNARDIIGENVAEASTLLFEGEAIPSGFATKLWSFMSLSGDRVMCVMTETENKETGQITTSLHLKADSKTLLFALIGSEESRKTVVAAMAAGMTIEA